MSATVSTEESCSVCGRQIQREDTPLPASWAPVPWWHHMNEAQARACPTTRPVRPAAAASALAVAEERISWALRVAREFGQIDGDHHKTWVIDQMVAALTGQPATGRGIAP